MRDYKKEYRDYHSKPEQIKRRAARNKARAMMTEKVGAKSLLGRDVNHKDRNPMNNSMSNLNVQSKSVNRGNNK
jgi:hypothetical protein